jgi:outer membrane protein assembly factor BamB
MFRRSRCFFAPAAAIAVLGTVSGCGGVSASFPSAAPAAESPSAKLPPPGKLVSWLQPGFDSAHTGFNGVEKKLKPKNVANLKIGWSFSAPGTVQSIVTDGSVAIANASNYVYAIVIKHGTQKWSFATYAGENNGYTAPAIGNNLVYVGCNVGGSSDQQGLCAVDEGSGKLKWSWYSNCRCAPSAFNLAGPVVSGSTVVFGYYTGGAYGKNTLIALNATTGALLWQVPAGSGNNSLAVALPAIDGSNVFAGTDYGLCSYQLTTGTLNWCSGPGDHGTAAAISNGVVYATTTSSGFYAFNETTGAQIWQYTPSAGAAGFYDPPAIAGSAVYFSMSNGGPVYALNAAAGSLLFSAGGGSWAADAISSPSVADGVLYVACNGGLCAYNASTGASLATIGPGASDVEAPAIANGRVYLVCGTRSGSIQLNPCMYEL